MVRKHLFVLLLFNYGKNLLLCNYLLCCICHILIFLTKTRRHHRLLGTYLDLEDSQFATEGTFVDNFSEKEVELHTYNINITSQC